MDDVACRVALLEAVAGAALTMGEKNIFITRDDVARHIGLRTESASIELGEFWARMCKLNRQHKTLGLREANANAVIVWANAMTVTAMKRLNDASRCRQSLAEHQAQAPQQHESAGLVGAIEAAIKKEEAQASSKCHAFAYFFHFSSSPYPPGCRPSFRFAKCKAQCPVSFRFVPSFLGIPRGGSGRQQLVTTVKSWQHENLAHQLNKALDQ